MWEAALSSTTGQYPKNMWQASFGSLACMKELISSALLRKKVKLDSPINGTTVELIQKSGLVFLKPEGQDDQGKDLYILSLPPLLLFSLHRQFALDIINVGALSPVAPVGENEFELYCAHMHVAFCKVV